MAKRINISAEEFADKHARRLKGSLSDIKAGISKVTESPTEKAAMKQDKMLSRLTESVTSGKWASRLRSVSTEDWKQKFLTKGVDRIPAGIDAAHAKVVEFAGQLLAHEASLQGEIDRLPDLTLQDSANRMVHWMEGMAKFRRK